MANNRLPHKQRTLEKIRNAKVLERLISHFNGEVELSATQVTVGLNLIKKYIPDLKSIEHTGQIDHRNVDELTDAEIARRIADLTAGNTEAQGSKAKPAIVH